MTSHTEKLYQSVLPIRNIIVTLQFTQKTSLRFFHQIELSSLLKHWLPDNRTFEQHFRIDCPESGRGRYARGDYYRFTLYGLGHCENHLQTLLNKLHKLPASAPVTDKKAPFRNNIKLVSLHDGFNEHPITDANQLSCYNQQSLQQEVDLWRSHRQLRLRFISPIRLLKDKDKRKKAKGEARFCRDSTDTDINLLLNRLHDRFAEFNRNSETPQELSRPPPPIASTHLCHFFWIDNHYTDRNSTQKIIGGMSGLIEFSFNPDADLSHLWPLLVLGQFTGLGQRTSFGYGRYLLETMDAALTHRRGVPTQSLLMRAASEDNLIRAYRHILKNTAQTRTPGDYPEAISATADNAFTRPLPEDNDLAGDEIEHDTLERLKKKISDMQHQQYNTPLLKGVLISKNDGGVRALAIPPFTDRVLQRALAQIISPGLEQLFYPRSYGYRPGKSRISAKENIQSAWRNGYQWVYESDIEDFFDSVNLQRLKERLMALYDNDAAISAIINWMSAAVSFEGEVIERKNGLPQGSPLSPLLANLMLDDKRKNYRRTR